jgi:hypothetical protein
MVRFFATEKFKEITVEDPLQLRYAVSNYGRLISFKEVMEEGRLIKGSVTDGYRLFRYKIRVGEKVKNKHQFISKLVAGLFLEKTSDEQVYVLHLDRNRANDFVGNLKWATKEEMLEHQRNSPFVKEARAKVLEEKKLKNGHKLTLTQVKFLKKELLNPNRKTRLKILAKKFGVSEMQLQRIRTGENWGHIEV